LDSTEKFYNGIKKNDYRLCYEAIFDGFEIEPYLNKEGVSIIHNVIEDGISKKIIELILDNSAINVNIKKKATGDTPGHVAAIVNRKDIIELLQLRGANLSLKNKDGKTPLEILNEPIEEYQKNKNNLGEITVETKRNSVLESNATKYLLNFFGVATSGVKPSSCVLFFSLLQAYYVPGDPKKNIADKFEFIREEKRYYKYEQDFNYDEEYIKKLNLGPEVIAAKRGEKCSYPSYYSAETGIADIFTVKEMPDIVSVNIAHNYEFHEKFILKILDDGFCTMQENKKIINAKDKIGRLKCPSLEETCLFYTNKFDENNKLYSLYEAFQEMIKKEELRRKLEELIENAIIHKNEKFIKQDIKNPRLEVELIPPTAWGHNVRSELGMSKWNQIRKKVYQEANNKCECCGKTRKKMDAHEVWNFDFSTGTQILERIMCICSHCHNVKHFIRAAMMGTQQLAYIHLRRVNEWSCEETEDYLLEKQRLCTEQSKRMWEIDLSYLKKWEV
jgi:hypothetical protein